MAKTALINNFGITNYRSIDDKGAFFQSIKKINLFIGKNNSGKSNVLKFIKALSDLKGSYRNFPDKIEDQHRRNGKSARIQFKIKPSELQIPEEYGVELFLFDFDLKNDKLSLRGLDMISHEHIVQLVNALQIPHSSDVTNFRSDIERYLLLTIKNNVLKFFDDVIYIPDFRIINESLKINSSNSMLNGQNIISEIFKMQNPDLGEEINTEKFEKIQETVRTLLNIEDLSIEIPHTKDKMLIVLHNNRLPLEYFGTGIHELIILCSAIIIHDGQVVCLEEPEIHLHPELQRKFFKFLLKSNNTFFITTHSNSFLDFSNEDVAIYHVTNNKERSSFDLCSTNFTTRTILDDLGYKTSDLLQSNGIIWVEGPSDRIFLKRWMELVDDNVIEGIHYSIMFYGGRLLSHLSCEIEFLNKELISLMKLNKNAFVMIDSDIANKLEINKTKKRIIAEIGLNNCWITKGKEIENYITNHTLNAWLKKKHAFNGNIELHPGDIFAAKVKSSSGVKYEVSKVEYSKQIIEFILKEDLKILDLSNKLEAIVSNIKRWNHLS